MDKITLEAWLDSLAAKAPTPGGGAVAALAAAIAAAQLGMVAIYTTGPKWQDREADMQKLSDELGDLRTEALRLVKADAEAFARVGSAYQLPKTTDAEKAVRQAAIQQALLLAAEPPRQTAQLAIKLIKPAEMLEDRGNPNVISDVAVASAMIRAALEAAIVNIEINERHIEDTDTKQRLQKVIEEAEQALAATDNVTETVRKHIRQ